MDRCANITARGRRRRLLMALAGAALAAAIVWLQGELGLARAVRLLSAGPLLMATYGFFQAREQTCVRLAWTGRRETEHGTAPIDDPFDRYRVKRQASVVHASAIISALAVAGVLYVA